MNRIEAALFVFALVNSGVAILLLGIGDGWAYVVTLMLFAQTTVGILCDV